jgi:hypothetical protein
MLRAGKFSKLERLELTQENGFNCRSLGGWVLPKVKTLAVNVTSGIGEFLRENPAHPPFDNMPMLRNFHLLSLASRTLQVQGIRHPVSSFLEAVLPAWVEYVRVTTSVRFFRFSTVHRPFPNVRTLNVKDYMLKSVYFHSDEPGAMLVVFPSVRKVFVTWDAKRLSDPTPSEGNDLMQHVVQRLGDEWNANMKIMEKEKNRPSVTSVTFMRP